MRLRELGLAIGELEPGPLDAITDVEGVRVGQTTVVEGDDVRTGVTVVVPPLPVFAAPHRLTGTRTTAPDGVSRSTGCRSVASWDPNEFQGQPAQAARSS